MKAINLLNNKEYEVKQYKNVLYYETGDSSLPYYILTPSEEKESEIEYGYLYTFYKIGDQLYDGYLSNVYKSFATDQLDIWEVLNNVST